MLVVDDDARNIVSLTAILELHNIAVISAGNGREAIKIIEKTAGIDVILMDIMMPEMDGYETIRVIRGMGKEIPIIALTAKSMKGDSEACIEAGASDYIAKPIDTQQRLSLLRAFI